MFAVIAVLYYIGNKPSPAGMDIVAGVFGQPVKFIMSLSGGIMKKGFSSLGVILQCITPSPIIWFGLVSGAKKKAKEV